MPLTLAMSNIFPDVESVKAFALEHHFQGIDWSFDLEVLPRSPMAVSRWVRGQTKLSPFEIRYHCPFYQLDLGHDDPAQAEEAAAVFRHIVETYLSRQGERMRISDA